MNGSVLRVWGAVSVLCLASFTMVTTEFAPIGLLSQIAMDLDESPSTVGLTVTLYAWIGAASGLLSGWVNNRMPRKTLLIALMMILCASSTLAALSTDLLTLLGARALGAVAHGVFWANVAATAAHIVPAHRVGLATSIVLGGITVATVMGVPLTNLTGQHSGWRTAFFCLGGLAAISAGAMALMLPSMEIKSPSGGAGLVGALKRRDLVLTFIITGLTAASHFGAYTFIEPFIGEIPDINARWTAFLLFAFGAAGFAGNLLSAFFVDRCLKPFIFTALMTMMLALIVLGTGGPAMGIGQVISLLVIWGMAIAALFTGLQTWVLRIAGGHTVPATAIHTAVLNSAIGLGVIMGGGALEWLGLRAAMLFAGLLVLPALVLMGAASAGMRSDRARCVENETG